MARVLDTKRSRFLLGGLVLAHLVLISRQVERGGGSSLLGQTVFAVLSPLQRMMGAGLGAVLATWSAYLRSPWPMVRAAAMAARSTTRTNSRGRSSRIIRGSS